MAEMTASEAIELLTTKANIPQDIKDSPFFSVYIRIKVDKADQIAAILQQQAQIIEAMKCCGNCINWINRPEKMSCKVHEMDVAQWCRCGEWQMKDGQNDV